MAIPNPDHSRWRSSSSRAASESPATFDGKKVLLQELHSLEWRISQLEAAIHRLLKMAAWGLRVYRRLGRLLLRTPFAGLCRKLMGQKAPYDQYRRWLLLHRATEPFVSAKPELGPLISVVIPVFQPQLSWLKEAVESVRAQSYGSWELLLVLDGGTAPETLACLQSYAREDPRIHCIEAERGGISATLNRGLNHSSAAYTAFIYQNDFLEPTALAHVTAAILHEEPAILYTDEDYVDERGNPETPIFKPAWSPALLLSCMYLGHLLVVETARAQAVGGFRSAHDGAQDYDLILRLTDESAKIVHIPYVLYHWRKHAGFSARTQTAKPYTHAAGLKAIEEAIARRHLPATVHGGRIANNYRLSHSFSADDSAAILIPTRNPKLLARLLASLHLAESRLSSEIHVILHCQGNMLDDEVADVCRKFGAQVFEYRGPFNFSLMNNLAAARVSARYLVFLNDDLVMNSGWLDDLCAPFLRPEVGIAGAELLYADRTIQHAGIVLGIGDGVGHSGRFQLGSPFWPWLTVTRNVSAVTGACLAIRRELFNQLGGFDTRYGNNYNDVDLCLRAQRSGLEIVLSCNTPCQHDEGRTRQTGTTLTERLEFWTQWGAILTHTDHYYSPNLSRRLETIELSAVAHALLRNAA